MFRPLAVLAAVATAMQAQQTEIAPGAGDPFALERFLVSHAIFDWNALRRGLGLKPTEAAFCGDSPVHRCSPELIVLSGPEQAILLLRSEGGEAELYWRFLRDRAVWRLTGEYGAGRQSHPRRHELQRAGGKPLLLVWSQGVRDGGLDSEIETVFDLSQARFDPVFSFAVTAEAASPVFGAGSRLSGTLQVVDADTIRANINVRYWGGWFKVIDLGGTEASAKYTRAKDGRAFTLRSAYDSKDRDLAVADFERIRAGALAGNLIRIALPRLKEIASGVDMEEKEWLRELVDKLPDGPETRELKVLLH